MDTALFIATVLLLLQRQHVLYSKSACCYLGKNKDNIGSAERGAQNPEEAVKKLAYAISPIRNDPKP